VLRLTSSTSSARSACLPPRLKTITVAAGLGVTDDSGTRPIYPGACGSLRCVEAGTETKQLWMCTSCGFIYDPDEGDPDGGIPPGTPFDEIPDSWFCPVCGARKADFEPYEE
jgi:rubredoxin